MTVPIRDIGNVPGSCRQLQPHRTKLGAKIEVGTKIYRSNSSNRLSDGSDTHDQIGKLSPCPRDELSEDIEGTLATIGELEGRQPSGERDNGPFGGDSDAGVD